MLVTCNIQTHTHITLLVGTFLHALYLDLVEHRLNSFTLIRIFSSFTLVLRTHLIGRPRIYREEHVGLVGER